MRQALLFVHLETFLNIYFFLFFRHKAIIGNSDWLQYYPQCICLCYVSTADLGRVLN